MGDTARDEAPRRAGARRHTPPATRQRPPARYHTPHAARRGMHLYIHMHTHMHMQESDVALQQRGVT